MHVPGSPWAQAASQPRLTQLWVGFGGRGLKAGWAVGRRDGRVSGVGRSGAGRWHEGAQVASAHSRRRCSAQDVRAISPANL